MMKLFIPAICLIVVLTTHLTSCKQDDPLTKNTSQTSTPDNQNGKKKCGDHSGGGCQNPTCAIPEPACGTPVVVNLVSGRSNCVVGTVTVSNGPTQLSVTYTTTGNYRIRGLHLFVGDISQVPTSWQGVNTSGFPYVVRECSPVNTYTINIPLSNLANCVSVAAEADISGISGCDEWSTQVAWGAGTAIVAASQSYGGHCGDTSFYSCNRGTYFSYCEQSCSSVCLVPSYLLFGNEVAWPYGVTSVTVGGYSYTESIISTIPASDAQTALFAVAELKIYGSNINPPASIARSSAIAETWLGTLGQLSVSSNFTAPANVETAIAAVKACEVSNYCSN